MKLKRNVVAAIVLVALVAAVIVCSIVGGATGASLSGNKIMPLEGTWTDRSEETGVENLVYFRYTITGDPYDGYLFMQTYGLNFAVLLDGKIVYQHTGDIRDGFTHLISVGRVEPEQTLTIVFSGSDIASLRSSRFYLADQGDMYGKLLGENLYALFFFVVAFMLSVVCIVLALVLRKHGMRHLFALGLFILTAGVWVVTDSNLMWVVTENSALVYALSFLTFYSMPISLLEFTRSMMNSGKRTLIALTLAFGVLLSVYCLSYLFGTRQLGNTLLLILHALLLLTIAVIAFYSVRELLKEFNLKLLLIALGYATFCICCVAAIAMFYAEPFSGYSKLYALGALGFTLFLFLTACVHIFERLQNSIDLEVRAKLAYRDVMTGVGNRAAFHEAQLDAQDSEQSVTYMMVDINYLKETNDRIGHSAGDELITRTAKCLVETVGMAGKCYRIGGDEFIALLRGQTEEEARAMPRRFYVNLSRENAEHGLRLSAAAGCAWFAAARGNDLDELFKQADAEMYKEKTRIKTRDGMPLTRR